jgi:hypothetical protein
MISLRLYFAVFVAACSLLSSSVILGGENIKKVTVVEYLFGGAVVKSVIIEKIATINETTTRYKIERGESEEGIRGHTKFQVTGIEIGREYKGMKEKSVKSMSILIKYPDYYEDPDIYTIGSEMIFEFHDCPVIIKLGRKTVFELLGDKDEGKFDVEEE